MSEEFPESEVARYWNANADAWAREVRQGHDVARERLNNPAFLAFVGDVSGQTILDVGCGEGLPAARSGRPRGGATGEAGGQPPAGARSATSAL
jgi:2-polyprenyl-3-methyl-5-hydroxy-6-metoxy-1,4-benzoquinol methylase